MFISRYIKFKMRKRDTLEVFGNLAIYWRPIAFRPRFATGLAFSNILYRNYNTNKVKKCQKHIYELFSTF